MASTAPRRRWLWGALGAAFAGIAAVVALVGLAAYAAYRVLAAPPGPPPTPPEPRSAAQAEEPTSSASGGRAVSALADPAWVEATAERLGIPERALSAYAGASLVAAEEHPGCRLSWNTLAGIGAVESEHGSIYGSRLGEDGVAKPAIIGIPLNGDGVQDITDTDRGALDGDAEHDRAVGPMQFIPQTWEIYGRDGSGDGAADPQNIDDAALSAAGYLCSAGGDLSSADDWIAAIHSYNPTVEYNNRVADAADRYAG